MAWIAKLTINMSSLLGNKKQQYTSEAYIAISSRKERQALSLIQLAPLYDTSLLVLNVLRDLQIACSSYLFNQFSYCISFPLNVFYRFGKNFIYLNFPLYVAWRCHAEIKINFKVWNQSFNFCTQDILFCKIV